MNAGDLVQVPCRLEKVSVPLNGGEPQDVLRCPHRTMEAFEAVRCRAMDSANLRFDQDLAYIGLVGPDDAMVHLYKVVDRG